LVGCWLVVIVGSYKEDKRVKENEMLGTKESKRKAKNRNARDAQKRKDKSN